ncbi:MAG: AAA family ATPase [Clostridia bacterium]|nr:AAA family ATPase [Clostridia bacterium]
MKLNHLKINGFGKLKNKEIELNNKINIIYGLNESGKSTLQKFILGSFFGLSKNKNGKEISDIEKLTPWNNDEFSGKIKYTLDDGKSFEVFRDFTRKNPIIYNENKVDISDSFSIDKNKGNNFFEEQTGIDETTFLDTALTEQQNVKLNKISQNNIIQKITNIISTGNENISYKRTLEKILKQQTDKIGTSRSSQKPLNIIENRIAELKREEFLLDDTDIEQSNLQEEIKKYNNIIEKENEKLNLLSEMLKYHESLKFRIAEVDFNKKLEEEYDEKIEDLKSKIDVRAKQNLRLQKKSYIKFYILFLIFTIISILLFVFNKNIIVNSLSLILTLGILVYIIVDKIIKNKKIKEKLKQIDELQLKINKEIEFLKQSKEQKVLETKIKNERLDLEFRKNDEYLRYKYNGKVDSSFIENVLAMDIDDIFSASNLSKEKIENAKIKLNTLNLESDEISNVIRKSKEVKDELNQLKEESLELQSLNNSYNLAITCLQQAYQEMKEQINPNLIIRLGEIIKKISNNKYANIIFDDENGLCVELENGRYIPAELLSIGTIDQLYLSLRLAVLEEISTETIPIILDEAFAYFDNERLENILDFISKEYPNNQIIIFTSSTREIEILKELKITNYNLIEL